MKNYFLVFILIGAVTGQNDFQRLSQHFSEAVDTLTSQWKDFTKSLPDEKTFGDVSRIFQSVKVAKREANENVNESAPAMDKLDVFLFSEVKEKCYSDGSSQAFDEASTNFDQCLEKVIEDINTDRKNFTEYDTDVMRTIMSACSHAPEVKKCFVDFVTVIQPCLPAYQGKSFPVAEIIQNVINFTCLEEGAKERLNAFSTDGMECLKSRKVELSECKNTYYPPESEIDLQEDSLLLTEDSCKNYPPMVKCFKDAIQNCTEPAKTIDFMEDYVGVIKEFYWPCEDSQKSEGESAS